MRHLLAILLVTAACRTGVADEPAEARISITTAQALEDFAAKQDSPRAALMAYKFFLRDKGISEAEKEAARKRLPFWEGLAEGKTATATETKTASPNPISEAPISVYLKDLPAIEFRSHADWGPDRPAFVGGKPSAKTFVLNPPAANQSAHAAFDIGGRYTNFTAEYGMPNDPWPERTAVEGSITFRVVADGKNLFMSKPTNGRDGKYRKVTLNIRGVKRLELFVDCAGTDAYANAQWVNPQVQNPPPSKLSKSDKPQR